jgi:hypothetical protein
LEKVTPVVDALLLQLDGTETPQPVRRAALESIGAATHPKIPGLIEDAYNGQDSGMQLSSLFAMGRSADKRWLSYIVDEMESPFVEMRIEAARAAGEIGSSDSVPALIELLYDDDLEVRLASVTSLGQIGGDLAYQNLEELLVDPFAEELHESIEEALEEITLFGGEIDLSFFDWENQ